MQIRHYPADARAVLTSPPDGPAWNTAFTAYLADLGAPHPSPGVPGQQAAWDVAASLAVAEWLAGWAVALAHADVADKCRESGLAEVAAVGAALDEADATAAGGGPPSTAPFPDAADPAVAAAADALAAAVRAAPRLSTATTSPAQHTAAVLAAAAASLESTLLPAAMAMGWDPGAPTSTPPAPTTDTAAAAAAIADALLPLGLPPGPGGPAGDRASAVARWLLWGDLRAQQTAVDGAIAACQEFTANAKTDAKLGKVGH